MAGPVAPFSRTASRDSFTWTRRPPSPRTPLLGLGLSPVRKDKIDDQAKYDKDKTKDRQDVPRPRS
jgi:hypothetical protein